MTSKKAITSKIAQFLTAYYHFWTKFESFWKLKSPQITALELSTTSTFSKDKPLKLVTNTHSFFSKNDH